MRLLIEGGGPLIIGGGESAGAIDTNIAVGSEELILASDTRGTYPAIRFMTSLQNGWTGRVEAMTIRGDGNVGIGTTAPSQKLTVAGNIGIQAGANAFIGTLDNYALSLRTNNADRIFITNGGNVGIGTTNPLNKLEVSGTFNATFGGGIIYLDNNGNIKVGI
jgi:hypothetical protein